MAFGISTSRPQHAVGHQPISWVHYPHNYKQQCTCPKSSSTIEVYLEERYSKHYSDVDDENTQKCLAISDALEESCKRGNDIITSPLDSYYFRCLSEDQKLYVFSPFWYTCSKVTYRYVNGHKTCLFHIVHGDNPTYLEQIMPYMPLHKFQACSLPTGLTWIESEEWMRDMLVKHKVRCNPDSIASNMDDEDIMLKKESVDDDENVMLKKERLDDDENVMLQKETVVNDSDIIQKLQDLAFTMLAAELFYICCWRKAINCCRYLLRIAPDLVNIKAGRDEAVALCSALTCDSIDVVKILEEQHAPIGNIAHAVHLVFYESSDSRSCSFIANVLKREEKSYREEVRVYKDPQGVPLLHLLFSRLLDRQEWNMMKNITQYLQSSIQTILDNGADPRVMNEWNETALDCLIRVYGQWQGVPTSARIKLFMQTLELILPSWGVALPSAFPHKLETVQGRAATFCKIAELLLNDEQAFKLTIRTMQNHRFFWNCKPTDCQLCRPAVSLLYRAMCKGIDVHSVPGKYIWDLADEVRCNDYVSYILRMIPKSSDKCCHWALLELLVHCGNNAFSQMHMRRNLEEVLYSHVSGVCDTLSQLVTAWFRSKSQCYLDQIHCIMSMLSMYAPSIFQASLPELQKSTDPVQRHRAFKDYADETVKLMLQTISQIHEKFERVRPLQLLCRLKIRESVMWNDIELLPFPRKLKHYLRIGDIPKSHVIHQIIAEMEADE